MRDLHIFDDNLNGEDENQRTLSYFQAKPCKTTHGVVLYCHIKRQEELEATVSFAFGGIWSVLGDFSGRK